jgi:hypothetical protein
VAKDSNGDACITNLHLLPSEAPKLGLRLFVTISQRNGPGRIESRNAEVRREADVMTLEATSVAEGLSTEYGFNQVLVFTLPSPSSAPQSA